MSKNEAGVRAQPNLRRHPRYQLEVPVQVSDANNRVGGRLLFDTQDLSLGGAFIRSDLLFEVGEELGLAFTLPTGAAVEARGRVVRVVRDSGDDVSPGMGIQFVQLSEGDKRAILALAQAGADGG
jgi:Tfp pilus assembly protein PilZ